MIDHKLFYAFKRYRYAIFTVIVLFSACSKPESEDSLLITKPVNSIAIDKDNTKWIGTDEGLYQSVSGGYQLFNSLAFGAVFSVTYEEKANLLWVGTNNGLFKMDLAGINKDNYSAISAENLSNQSIRCSYVDSSLSRWFGADVGITLNSGDEWKNDSFRINTLGRIFPMKIEQLAINSISNWDGDYFFATNGGSLYRASGLVDSVDAFSGATQWISPYNGQNITDTMFVVFTDSKGNQWMGGENGIQVHSGHDPKSQADFTYYNSELVSGRIHSIVEAPDGKIWIGTEGGISIFNITAWSSIISGLPDLFITSIAFDKEDGSAWIGTKKGLVNIK